MALSVGQKAGWGLADLGINVFVVVKQLLVFAFMSTYLGVPPAVAGVLTFSVLAFDVITDPLIGYLSDRTHSRFGRRYPWMFVGAVVQAIGIVGIFMVPDGMSWQANAAWVMAFFALATLGFTAVTIPYGAMAGEMTQDPQERSVMMAWRMGFASLGLLTAGAVVPALAGDTKAGFGMAVLYVSPVMILAIWLSIAATRRAPRIATPTGLGMGQMLRLVLSNRRFTLLVVIYGVLTLGVALIAAGLQLSALYLIAGTGGPMAGLATALGVFAALFAMFIVGSVISQAIWVLMAKRFGKLQALVVGMVAYTVVLWLIYSLLPSTSISTMAALFVLVGFFNGAYQQLPWAMYPDLMDVTRNESGESVEGAFAALWLFGQKVANALAPLVLGLVLSAYGFVESTQGATTQSATALEALRWAVTLLPAAIMWIGIAMLVMLYRPRAKGIHEARQAA